MLSITHFEMIRMVQRLIRSSKKRWKLYSYHWLSKYTVALAMLIERLVLATSEHSRVLDETFVPLKPLCQLVLNLIFPC